MSKEVEWQRGREDLENANPTGCPTGYRVPNVREGAIMALYCSSDWWNKLKADNWGRRYAMVATTYSKGAIAGKDPMRSSWQFGYRAAPQGMGATINIVPVRDVKQDSVRILLSSLLKRDYC